MPIVHSSPKGERGRKDAKRHRDKQREIIRKKLPDIISEENIITDKKGRKVKVPIRGVVIPDLRPGKRKKEEGGGSGANPGGGGIGQGKGKQGDVIGRKPAPGGGGEPGEAGEEPGEDFIETEIDIEEVIEMMLEDLGLPNIEKKDVEQLEIDMGFKISGLRKSGPPALLFKKRTAREGIKRFYMLLDILEDETGKNKFLCAKALEDSNGNLNEARELLSDAEFLAGEDDDWDEDDINPFPIFEEEDLRFHNLEEQTTHESNAVIIIELDVSGSMTTVKKYLARSIAFWLTEFLRKIYDNVEIRFIIYHSTARIVDEHTAFHTMESGGTVAYEAHKKAIDLIETQYPTKQWNVYVFQFSDGWDFNPEKAVEGAKMMIEKLKINMFGYAEIHVDEYFKSMSNLFNEFYLNMPLNHVGSDGGDGEDMIVGSGEYPFIGCKIEEKEQLWAVIREFLYRERWSK